MRQGLAEAIDDLPDVVRVWNIASMRAGDDIPGIGYEDGGALVTYHVTDDPLRVLRALRRRAPLMAAYGPGGRHAELGPGLYTSGSPGLWLGRARRKWDFLERLSPAQLHRLAAAISSELEHKRADRYISQTEYDNARRDIGHVLARHYGPEVLVRFADQPYNVRFWTAAYLEQLGIEPGPKARVLALHVVGELAEVSRSHPSQQTLRILRRAGLSGAFTRASMATNPELCVWEVRAIVGAREVAVDELV